MNNEFISQGYTVIFKEEMEIEKNFKNSQGNNDNTSNVKYRYDTRVITDSIIGSLFPLDQFCNSNSSSSSLSSSSSFNSNSPLDSIDMKSKLFNGEIKSATNRHGLMAIWSSVYNRHLFIYNIINHKIISILYQLKSITDFKFHPSRNILTVFSGESNIYFWQIDGCHIIQHPFGKERITRRIVDWWDYQNHSNQSCNENCNSDHYGNCNHNHHDQSYENQNDHHEGYENYSFKESEKRNEGLIISGPDAMTVAFPDW